MIPLKQIAVNDGDHCIVKVLHNAASEELIIGALAMQSLYVNGTQTNASLQLADNTFKGAYIGSERLPEGPNPFATS